MTYAGWEAIDRAEKRPGEPHGRPRVKLCSFEELLEAARERVRLAPARLTASPSSASSARSGEAEMQVKIGVSDSV